MNNQFSQRVSDIITYSKEEAKPVVVESIKKLIAEGKYPEKLYK